MPAPDPQMLLRWLERLPTNLAGKPVDAETPLIESGLLDSLGILELVSFLEDGWEVTLPLDEFVAENFRTPAAILAMAARLRAGLAGA
ncbi:MAG TPA: acyl carrier protein [Stellaceae bacterium]|nr:acyl carrier protein [Stellaceae bacterium]